MAPARTARVVDPRLLHYARATRTFILSSVALGTAGALLIVAQAWLLTDVVCEAFLHGHGLASMRAALAALLAVVLLRALLAWASEVLAARSSTAAKSQLRGALLARAAALIPGGQVADRTGELAVLATSGLDALDDYFALYLPAAAARRDRAGARGGSGARRRLDLGSDHHLHDPADPAVHGPDRIRDAGTHRTRAALPAAPRGPLPGRRRGAADAEAVRPLACPGRGHRGGHRTLPALGPGHAEGHVPVLAGARAGGHPVGGDRGGRDRPAAARRQPRPAGGAVRAGARPGGVSAASPPRRQLPRERRRRGRRRAGVRGAGDARRGPRVRRGPRLSRTHAPARSAARARARALRSCSRT